MNPEPFFYWINERYYIWERKERLKCPPPWTVDPILREYRFCNVFREDDRVTRWICDNIRKPYAAHPQLWHMLFTARFINWPDTLQDIMNHGAWYAADKFDPKPIIMVMRARAEQGEQVWTNAYTVSTNGRKMAKPDYIVGHVLEAVWQQGARLFDLAHGGASLEAFCEEAQKVEGVGGFMAYEVACDLRWCPGWLDNAQDVMTWANLGPGAKRGLNRLSGRPLEQSIKDAVALQEMRYLLDLSNIYLQGNVPALEMRDIEHSLCETDKYLRVKNGEGTPRSKYKPQGE